MSFDFKSFWKRAARLRNPVFEGRGFVKKPLPPAFFETVSGKRLMRERGYRFARNNPGRNPPVDNEDFLRGFEAGKKFVEVGK
jgi:hypothetical protein